VRTVVIPGFAALLAALGAGCRIGGDVQPITLRGPAPEAIAVWPVAGGPELAAWMPALLDGLDAAVLRRGYTILSHEVTWTLGFAAPVPHEPAPAPEVAANDLTEIGRRLRVDAILVLHVRRFEADAVDRLRSATWDLRWELQSTRGHGLLWSFEHNGSWLPPRDGADPHRPLDAEPGPVPFGVDRQPSFRDVRELSSWLNRYAMEHLPARSR